MNMYEDLRPKRVLDGKNYYLGPENDLGVETMSVENTHNHGLTF